MTSVSSPSKRDLGRDGARPSTFLGFTTANDRGYSATHEAISVGYLARCDRRANGLLHCPPTSSGGAEHNCEPAPGRYRPLHPHAGRGEKSGRLASHGSLSIISRAGDAGLF